MAFRHRPTSNPYIIGEKHLPRDCGYALQFGGLGGMRKIQIDSVWYGAGSRPQSCPYQFYSYC